VAAVKQQVYEETLHELEYAAVCVSKNGGEPSGDMQRVIRTPRGVLLAVVDGAGHGREAASAASAALETLEANAADGVISLIQRCHERLKGTRGAVMSLILLDTRENTITAAGVGNIEAMVLRGGPEAPEGSETMLARPGLLGYRLPLPQAIVAPIAPGDLLILVTDGISRDFTRVFSAGDSPATIAEYIASRFQCDHDDSLVLVGRYRGDG
jgi:phosphoserine phosphatase RsbX